MGISLANPSFLKKASELGQGAAWAKVSLTQQKAEHSQKEQKKALKKKKGMLLSQDKLIKQDSFCLKSKDLSSAWFSLFPLLGGQQP